LSGGDWRSNNNNGRWNVVPPAAQPNNPCPAGYRVPTEAQFEAERALFPSQDAAGAFSALKLTLAGSRAGDDGAFFAVNIDARYWTSTVNGSNSMWFRFRHTGAPGFQTGNRSRGLSVRCIKD
jgi:hypothetical protein